MLTGTAKQVFFRLITHRRARGYDNDIEGDLTAFKAKYDQFLRRNWWNLTRETTTRCIVKSLQA